MNTRPAAPHSSLPEHPRAGAECGRVYSGLQPAERTRERYQKFIDAGIELFGTVGYASAKIKTLCHCAGLSERYFYESFDSREQLLTEVYETVSTELMVQVTEALSDPEANPKDAIRASLAAVVNFMLGDPRHAQIILVEIVGVSEELEAKRHQAMSNFAGQSMGALLILAGIKASVVKQLLGGDLGSHGGGSNPGDSAGARLQAVDPNHPLAEALEFARLTSISMVGGVNNMLLDAVIGGTTTNSERIIEVSYQLLCNASSGIRALSGTDATAAAPKVTPAT
ncbi:TetR/AcrR family transcriptional regulator [Arthrobacter sp. N199823]|uniref:TetR/AcrR family transcriptional regulator n=1 Tax=Arthrobacter sp. N199823 TaxID=2058895 RepID=UPI0015E2DDF2|nr:TetR/AcrR family transcriptional regulator [Arthrobacter sp. N199823]